MKIGVPKEIKIHENRVALTPHGALELIKAGHEVFVETKAGVGSGYFDSDYADLGVSVESDAKSIFDCADMIVKVKEPQDIELEMIRKGQIIFTYFHFASSQSLTEKFIQSGASAVAYETIMLADKSLPLLVPMSEVAGKMSVQEGAKFLEKSKGGRGILLGGVPGVAPANVMIIGGGIVGTNAAWIASGLGATVFILDNNLNRLRYLDEIMPANVNTIFSNHHNIESLLPETDLLVGAVLIPGAKAPSLVSRKMLSLMRKGSVIVDVAVDQGGCVETCKPTTHEDPTYVVDGVVHYCVANMPGAVPFTSTIALTNATFPYLSKLANQGLEVSMKNDASLLVGLNIYDGKVTHKGVSDAFELEFHKPNSVF
ncbi:MAG: alanine dehydrogenase [Candidatus Marinimicrobia bacterium]|nr:alanine dehydrogenase [Candidatus Neomarinimicrobiota bacterium]MBT3496592.1 alanine dehydrogenase [Candidatus Neomarinimicrobiota bacterium]MBT3692273.1 alanine dehydrogenase [Candidatus Neomarinimicrobiota bacterium]MBT3732944.1 alanine dehydrogenase [Candidatus Neomarinimicrobiota bacterium]MBT4145005.1 alanine dehydrogenase [Candidatus Neomarinimicrobiota bacterium]